MKRILLIAAGLLWACSVAADSQDVLRGSVAIEAGSYQSYTLTIDQSEMTNPAVVGHVEAAGGTGNDIKVFVMSKSDYLNWKNDHPVSALYASGQVTAADVNVSLPTSGTYYVVISNAFSTLTPKTVSGTLRLTWTPAVVAAAAATGVMGAGVLAIVALLAIPGLIGAAIVWAIMNRRKRTTAH